MGAVLICSLIFWTDWNRKTPEIASAGMDGSNRRVVVSEGLGLPNGLTIDYRATQICWADAGKINYILLVFFISVLNSDTCRHAETFMIILQLLCLCLGRYFKDTNALQVCPSKRLLLCRKSYVFRSLH